MRTRLTGALTALILTLLVLSAPASAVTYAAGFEGRTLVSGGLHSPTGVAWTADPDIALADSNAKKLRSRKLRRTRRPQRSGKHPGPAKGSRPAARRCPARSARRGGARHGAAKKACKRKGGRRR